MPDRQGKLPIKKKSGRLNRLLWHSLIIEWEKREKNTEDIKGEKITLKRLLPIKKD